MIGLHWAPQISTSNVLKLNQIECMMAERLLFWMLSLHTLYSDSICRAFGLGSCCWNPESFVGQIDDFCFNLQQKQDAEKKAQCKESQRTSVKRRSS